VKISLNVFGRVLRCYDVAILALQQHGTRSSAVAERPRVDRICRLLCSFIRISCNRLPDSFRQSRQSSLDSPLHARVNPPLSSSPLSASITSSRFLITAGSKSTFSTNPSHLNRLLVAVMLTRTFHQGPGPGQGLRSQGPGQGPGFAYKDQGKDKDLSKCGHISVNISCI